MLGNRALLPVGEAVVGFIQGGIQHLPEVQLVRPGGGIYRHILAGLITVLIVLQAEIRPPLIQCAYCNIPLHGFGIHFDLIGNFGDTAVAAIVIVPMIDGHNPLHHRIGIRRHGNHTALRRADVVLNSIRNVLFLKGDKRNAYGRIVLLQGS